MVTTPLLGMRKIWDGGRREGRRGSFIASWSRCEINRLMIHSLYTQSRVEIWQHRLERYIWVELNSSSAYVE